MGSELFFHQNILYRLLEGITGLSQLVAVIVLLETKVFA